MFSQLTCLIFNYNTPDLVCFLLRSLHKSIPDFDGNIIIWDNSSYNSMPKEIIKYLPNIEILDNTHENLVNYNNDIFQKNIVRKDAGCEINNFGSAKHCYCINEAIKKYVKTKYVLLLDSDVLIKKNFVDLFIHMQVNEYSAYGLLHNDLRGKRFHPCFTFIDLEKIQLINFYNKDFMLGLNSCKIKYDTGCWFYETLLKNKHKIDTFSLQNDYFIHAEGLSWDKNKNKHYITKYTQYWK